MAAAERHAAGLLRAQAGSPGPARQRVELHAAAQEPSEHAPASRWSAPDPLALALARGARAPPPPIRRVVV
eukprot:11849040-Alexandrium_andersonii.AAC.1